MLQAQGYSDQAIRLSWEDKSTNETNFSIVRYDYAILEDVPIAQLPANTTEYFDTGLQPGVIYKYQVIAQNNAGDSPNSNAATATAKPAATKAPDRPSNFTASVSGTQITLNWQNNIDFKTGFRIYRKDDTSGSLFSLVGETPSYQTSFIDTVSAPTAVGGKTYFYEIESFHNVKGVSASRESLPGTGGILVPQIAVASPSMPQMSNAEFLGDGRIKIAWQAAADTNTRLRIERSVDGGSSFSIIAWLPGSSREYIDLGLDLATGLAINANYCYRVATVNSAGQSLSDKSNLVDTLNIASVPTVTPNEFKVENVNATSVNLSWKNSSSYMNVRKLTLQRALASASPSYSNIASLPPTSTGFVDNAVAGETNYLYQLLTENVAGPSASPTTVSVITPKGLPQAPTNVSAFVQTPGTITVRWTPTEAGLKYRLFRSEDGGNTYAQTTLSDIATDVSYAYADNFTYAANATYRYRLFAYKDSPAIHSTVVAIVGETPAYTLTITTSGGLSIAAIGATPSPSNTTLMSCAADTTCTFDFATAATVTFTPPVGGFLRGCDFFAGTDCVINLHGDRSVLLFSRLIIIGPVLPPIKI